MWGISSVHGGLKLFVLFLRLFLSSIMVWHHTIWVSSGCANLCEWKAGSRVPQQKNCTVATWSVLFSVRFELKSEFCPQMSFSCFKISSVHQTTSSARIQRGDELRTTELCSVRSSNAALWATWQPYLYPWWWATQAVFLGSNSCSLVWAG